MIFNDKSLNNWITYKFTLRTQASKEKGVIQLQIFANGQRIRRTIGVSINKKHWNTVKEIVTGPNAEEHNSIINQYKLTLIDIQNKALAEKSIPTKEDIIEALTHSGSSDCFIVFMQQQHKRRLTNFTIEKSTFRTQGQTVKHLYQCFKELSFSKVNHSSVQIFIDYLSRHYKDLDEKRKTVSYHQNTIWGHIKTFKTYVNIAIREGHIQANPFEKIKIKRGRGRITYLTYNELKSLIISYKEDRYKENQGLETTLITFLFACFTGLRVSDILNFRQHNIVGRNIVIEPQKGKAYNSQTIIPLNNMSEELLDSIGPKLFTNLHPNTLNSNLKTINKDHRISKNATMHVGRHTFATEFLRRGGQLHVLKDLLGHSKINTTQIYVHLDITHAREQMQLMNEN